MASRRLLLLVALVLLGALAAPASGDDYSRKQSIDARLRSDFEIGSSCDRARQNDRTVAVVDDGPFGSFRLE